jgi:TetR/AcrR family acrAB operon transcriptional repressor
MVRRTKKEAAATREALLDAALRIFRERGVAQATLAEVAAAAGVTRGAVYWHFRDKADIFDALCAQVTLPMEAMLARASETRQEDPLAALRSLAVLGLTRLARDSRAQAVFDVTFHTCELTGQHAPITERRRSTGSDCRAHVERLLKQAVARRQLPPRTDTGLAAQMIDAFMVGVMQQWVEAPGAYDLARAAPAMVDSLVAGLAARPPLRARRSAMRQSVASQTAPRRTRSAC